MTTPILILVNPQMGENIGAVARAMMNFGLGELRLVAPRDGWPNPAAEAMAAHGLPIIESAKVFATTREAIADLHYIYASTARDRRMLKPQLAPREAAQDIIQRDRQKTGILFGPERSGLTNDDIALAHAILTIPTDEKNSSLNIAQSAVIIAYEYWLCHSRRSERLHAASDDGHLPPADAGTLNIFFDHLEAALDETHFFKVEEKKPRMWRNLRTALLRAEFTEAEVQSLHGVISALAKPHS